MANHMLIKPSAHLIQLNLSVLLLLLYILAFQWLDQMLAGEHTAYLRQRKQSFLLRILEVLGSRKYKNGEVFLSFLF